MINKKLFVIVSLLLFSSLAAAQCGATPAGSGGNTAPSTGSGIIVTEPQARASIPNGAVYMTLTNAGTSNDTLLKIESDAAQAAELHETQIDEQGVMRMRPIERLPLPAGEAVSLKAGGKHIMLIDLKEGLAVGDHLRLTLTFEKAGTQTVEVPIQESLTGGGKAAEGEHSHHQ
jgi:periplasmic copper chaperone A